MKASYIFMTALLGLFAAGCSTPLESGKDYPALALGNETLTFKIDKVLQNDIDVKPHFPFFDEVTLTLSYKDGQPSKLTFSEAGAPFSVVPATYTDVDWEISSGSSPYEIRLRSTGEVICYITRNRMVTFPFKLGAPSNNYEYQLLPVEANSENE